jgi:hypothetical protein
MNLDRKLFWDVDYDKLDWEKYASWVIVRVFERGDVDDIRQVRRHYGDEKISDSLLNAKSIRLERLYLASAVIDQPLEKFKCYLNQQLNPKLFRF